MRRAVCLTVLCLAALGAPPASAHYQGTANSSLDAAVGPLQMGVVYSGRFGSVEDVDYYHFDIAAPNVSLRFTVTDTTTYCPADIGYCHLYATLVDPAGNQLGGEGSAAGTGPVGFSGSGYSTQTLDWTFPAPGRYYLVLDSEGDLPSYDFRMDPAPPPPAPGSGGSGGSTGGSHVIAGALFRFFPLRSPQRATRVGGELRIYREGTNVRLDLLRSVRGRTVIAGHLTRTGLHPGRLDFRVPVNPAARAVLRKHHRLWLRLRVRATARGYVPVVAARPVMLVTTRLRP